MGNIFIKQLEKTYNNAGVSFCSGNQLRHREATRSYFKLLRCSCEMHKRSSRWAKQFKCTRSEMKYRPIQLFSFVCVFFLCVSNPHHTCLPHRIRCAAVLSCCWMVLMIGCCSQIKRKNHQGEKNRYDYIVIGRIRENKIEREFSTPSFDWWCWRNTAFWLVHFFFVYYSIPI